MSDNLTNNKRLARNTTFLYVRMFFALVVNLFSTRVLLDALGVVDYGVYNVVAGFVSLFGFLNASLSASVQRFYNYEGVQKGDEGFQNVYVTALMTHAAMALLLFILLESFGLWYVNKIMVVPEERIFAANILFQLSIFSLVLTMMQIPYIGAVMAREHMDFFSIFSIVDVLLKLFIALVVANSSYDNLVTYAVLLACLSVVDILAYIIYCKRHFIEMKLKKYLDMSVFKEMLAFSGWNLIGTFAFMLKGQGINMLLNVFFGPVINAARGVAYQVNGAISGFSSSIYTAFGPQIVESYAEGNTDRTVKMMFAESRICFSLICIIVVPVVLEINYLLRLWLGENIPEYASVFAVLVLVDTLICALNTPCTQVVQATGRIKKYQIGSSIVNLCLIPFAWVLLKCGFPSQSAFVATILISFINQAVCVLITNKEIQFGAWNYLVKIVLRCIIIVLSVPLIPLLLHSVMSESLLRVIVVSLTSLLCGIVLTFFIMLDKEEREIISSNIKTRINNN